MTSNPMTVSEVYDRGFNPPALLSNLGATFVEEAALGQFKQRWHYSRDSAQTQALLLSA